MLLSLVLAVAQLVVQAGAPGGVDDRALGQVAVRESPLPQRLRNLILDDPAARAALRRVGFPAGCKALGASQRAVSDRHAAALAPFVVAAIRATVPAARLAEMPVLSFYVGPLQVYKSRVVAAVERSAAPLLATAEREVRADFAQRVRALPSMRDPAVNVVRPRADVAAALGMRKPYDLDDPAQLGLACAELSIDPAARPTITTGAPRPAGRVLPPGG